MPKLSNPALFPPVAALLAACAPASMPAPEPVPAVATNAFADVEHVEAQQLAAGVRHVFIHDPRGPWAIHVIEIDGHVCRPTLEVRKADGPLSTRATTSALAAGAIATINADFFRLPGGTPVGAHIARGVPFIGPTQWPVLAVSASGAWAFGTARLHGVAAAAADSVPVVQLNRASQTFIAYPRRAGDGVTLFTARADSVPADSAARRVLLRLLEGDERAGRAVVVAVDSPAAATVLSAGSAMLHAHDGAHAWSRRRAPGDTVTWRIRVTVPVPDGGPELVPVEAVGGFPALLRAGRDVLGEQEVNEAFGQRRHPRTAVGWTADQSRLFMVVVDGRQEGHSDGMTLPELTWVFRRLQADHALNLDGGGSTALALGTTLVNRPSDTEGERAVGNALSLVRCETPSRARTGR